MRHGRILMLLLACLALLAADKPTEKTPKHEVSISGLQFKPATLKIKAGDTVVWTNNDDRDHTVSSKDSGFKSDNLKSGQTFEYTFSKAGKFSYICTYHPRMKGEITVD